MYGMRFCFNAGGDGADYRENSIFSEPTSSATEDACFVEAKRAPAHIDMSKLPMKLRADLYRLNRSLEKAFPDKVLPISMSGISHRSLKDRMKKLYPQLGLRSVEELFIALGYHRSSTLREKPPRQFHELLMELQNRVKARDGVYTSMTELRNLNPDLSRQIRIFTETCASAVGKTPSRHLTDLGILRKNS